MRMHNCFALGVEGEIICLEVPNFQADFGMTGSPLAHQAAEGFFLDIDNEIFIDRTFV